MGIPNTQKRGWWSPFLKATPACRTYAGGESPPMHPSNRGGFKGCSRLNSPQNVRRTYHLMFIRPHHPEGYFTIFISPKKIFLTFFIVSFDSCCFVGSGHFFRFQWRLDWQVYPQGTPFGGGRLSGRIGCHKSVRVVPKTPKIPKNVENRRKSSFSGGSGGGSNNKRISGKKTDFSRDPKTAPGRPMHPP